MWCKITVASLTLRSKAFVMYISHNLTAELSNAYLDFYGISHKILSLKEELYFKFRRSVSFWGT